MVNHQRILNLFLIILGLFCITHTAHAVFKGLTRSLKLLHIKSISQKIHDQDRMEFRGDVEVQVDERMHVWADYVFADKAEQIIIAEGSDGSPVIIEDNNFLIFADRFVFNIAQKTGEAQNLKFHIEEGFVSAKKAEKINDNDWRVHDMTYTACDNGDPHWHIRADHAVVHGSYFIRATGLVFKVGQMPVMCFPRFVIPIQGGSKSGFLMPRFFIDYDYGFGVKQEYYKYISPHCDTTVGVDWRAGKGVVFFDEFRWARSPESYTLANVQYAVIRDRFMRKQDKIVKTTEHRYWINGKDFQNWPQVPGKADVCSLMRLDFGTDKRIGYHFFNSTEEIDDTFSNSLIVRSLWPQNLVWFQAENAKTSRKTFDRVSQQERQFFTSMLPADFPADASSLMIKELEDRVNLAPVPHIEWNTAFTKIHPFFSYRHDCFFDQILYRQEECERIYFNSMLISQHEPLPLKKTDLMRFNYRGSLTESLSWAYNTFSFHIHPTLQCVSQRADPTRRSSGSVLERSIFNKGAYRLFFEYGAEWTLPEGFVHSSDYSYMHSIQPVLTWDWLPKFFQDHWFYLDKWDRAYPKNQLGLLLRNTWTIDDLMLDVNVRQGYDFYASDDIFYLRRGIKQKHITPLRYEVDCQSHYVQLGVAQEYEWGGFQLLQSEINASVTVNRVQLGVGYLFQKRELQEQRQLLSHIPHFVVANLAIPLSSRATLAYEGQFYAPQRSSIFFFDGITPLIHRIRLDYDGHCWGFYIGFEEKKFKEYGNARNERAIVFSFRLDSLGSFAKKFKRMPQILRTQA